MRKAASSITGDASVAMASALSSALLTLMMVRVVRLDSPNPEVADTRGGLIAVAALCAAVLASTADHSAWARGAVIGAAGSGLLVLLAAAGFA